MFKKEGILEITHKPRKWTNGIWPKIGKVLWKTNYYGEKKIRAKGLNQGRNLLSVTNSPTPSNIDGESQFWEIIQRARNKKQELGGPEQLPVDSVQVFLWSLRPQGYFWNIFLCVRAWRLEPKTEETSETVENVASRVLYSFWYW